MYFSLCCLRTVFTNYDPVIRLNAVKHNCGKHITLSLIPSCLQRLMLQPGPVATKVVCLTQVVTPDELKDDEEYEDILEDMRVEGGKFGITLQSQFPFFLLFFFFHTLL